MKWTYTVAKVTGIPIRVHMTTLIILFMLSRDFREIYGAWGAIYGVVLGIGVLVSITLHELGHSFVAIRKGSRVREILLTPIGGVAQMTSMPSKPRDEFLVAVVGPAVSLLLAVIFYASFVGVAKLPLGATMFHDMLARLCLHLGISNFGWVIFNLIPAFPMDGGRILRSLLAKRMGRLRATRLAATFGKVFAVLFVFLGFTYLKSWTLVLIGFFIYWAAGAEYRSVLAQEMGPLGSVLNFWGPSGFGQPPPLPEEDRENVIISPPPYERGRGSKSQLHSDDGT